MTDSRSSKLMEEWRAVADAAAMPATAPRPKVGSRVGMGAPVLVAAVVLVALTVRGLGSTPAAPRNSAIAGASSSIEPSPTSVPPSDPITIAPPTAEPAHSPFPAAGGTCTADQFTLGSSEYFYGYGAVGTTVVFVTEELRNDGKDCLLELPLGIGVAPESGSFDYVSVVRAGDRTSSTVQAGQQVTIMLQDTWYLAGGASYSHPPCEHTISDVTMVELPLARGSLQFKLGTTWHDVCDSPPSVGLRLNG